MLPILMLAQQTYSNNIEENKMTLEELEILVMELQERIQQLEYDKKVREAKQE